MKRISCLFLVLSFVIMLCACGISENSPSPFDGLAKAMSYEDVVNAYGNNYDKTSSSNFSYNMNYDYSWLGREGILSVHFSNNNKWGISSYDVLDHASWTDTSTVDSAKTVETIIKEFDKKYGEHEINQGTYVWYDSYGHKYSIYTQAKFPTVEWEY